MTTSAISMPEMQPPPSYARSSRLDSVRLSPAVEDTVELSPAAKATNDAEVDGSRQQRIEQVRDQIAAGTYLTPEKLNVALERLLASLAG